MKTIKYSKLSEHATEPSQKRITDAGFDLYTSEAVVLGKFQSSTATQAVPTGIAFDIPEGMEGSVRPRSGLSLQGNMMVWYGTVDEEYTGEVKVIVTNLTTEPLMIPRGFKIAQIVFSERPYAEMVEVDKVEEKDRGDKGFGSSGNISKAYCTTEELADDVHEVVKKFNTPEGEKEGVEVTLFPEVGQVYGRLDNGSVVGENGESYSKFIVIKEVSKDLQEIFADIITVVRDASKSIVRTSTYMSNASLDSEWLSMAYTLVYDSEILEAIKQNI